MNPTKPAALLLTPVLPWPTGSGRALRAWDWLQTLGKDYRVYVISLEKSVDCVEIPEDYPAEKIWMTANAKQLGSKFRRWIGLLFPFLAPWFRSLVVDWRRLTPSDTMLRELEISLGRSIEYIVVFRLYMHNIALELSSRFPDAIMDLDLDDLESLTRLSVAGSLTRMRRFREAIREIASAIQYWFLERWAPGPYRTAYLASQNDCHLLSTRLAERVVCRPNRLNVPESVPPVSIEKELTLLFVGHLGYPPNEEAVCFLALCLAPELEKQLTLPWRLCVIGRHPSAELLQLMRGASRLEYISTAHHLERWYAEAHIVLIPLRAGGGTKYKTLEGFAHRRPLVSTRHGMRGLRALPGRHYLLAETATAFALAIERLAEDPALADRIAEAGWELCRKDYRIK
jgi:polysaccharide biosynthesis protein PslH